MRVLSFSFVQKLLFVRSLAQQKIRPRRVPVFDVIPPIEKSFRKPSQLFALARFALFRRALPHNRGKPVEYKSERVRFRVDGGASVPDRSGCCS